VRQLSFPQRDLSVLIVNYNGGRQLHECLSSLSHDPLIRQSQVIVVDNASEDGSAREVAAQYPVELISLDHNDGFGSANNVGLSRCTGRYTLMVNPDTWLSDGDMRTWVRFMDAHPRAGLAGPRLVGPDGSLQPSIRNYPTVFREAFEALYLHRILPKLTNRCANVVQTAEDYDHARPAEWVSGAAMMARTEAILEIGGFDRAFFLYMEEVDLCRRLTEAGWEVWYDPEVTVVHVGGAYSVDPFLAVESQKSRLRYFRKHHGFAGLLAFGIVNGLRLTVRVAVFSAARVICRGESWPQRSSAVLASLRSYPGLVRAFALARDSSTVAVESPEDASAGALSSTGSG
jgi:GT2 family glycosyltransferase